MKTNYYLKLYIIAELIVPFFVSCAIARQYQNNALIILLYLPLANAILPILHKLFQGNNITKDYIDIYNSAMPDFDIRKSTGAYFRQLHSAVQQNITEVLSVLKPKRRNPKQIYNAFCKIRSSIAAINSFRLFPASLMLEPNTATLFFLAAVLSITVPAFIIEKSNKSCGKTAIMSFFTLPQRATVMFDAYFRSMLKPLSKLKIVRRYIEKSQYGRHHSFAILYTATYFWAFFLSFMLIFSRTDVIALSGVLFSLAPIYYMYAEGDKSANLVT